MLKWIFQFLIWPIYIVAVLYSMYWLDHKPMNHFQSFFFWSVYVYIVWWFFKEITLSYEKNITKI